MLKTPELGEALPAAVPSHEAIDLLWRRRSTPADFLGAPGPDDDTLHKMLTIAARVPDHRRVTPFRFILFQDDARARFGDILKTVFKANEMFASGKKIEFEKNRFMRAPVVVAVISTVDRKHRTPEWEQILTAGAACQNLLLAASAHGFAAQWITEWYAYDEKITTELGLSDDERVAGFIYIGTAKEDPKERGRPNLDAIVTHF